MANEELLDFAGEIYEASYRPEHWPSVLAMVAQRTGSGSVFLGYMDNERPEASQIAIYPEDDPRFLSAMREYQERYIPLDPMRRLLLAQKPLGEAAGWNALVPGREAWRRECGEDFYGLLQRYDMTHIGGVLMFDDDNKSLAIGMQRYGDTPPWSPAETAFLSALSPHFQRAFRIHKEFTGLRLRQRGQHRCLDHMILGTAVLDITGRVIYTNAMAEALLAEHPAIAINAGQISAASARQTRELNDLIAAAFAASRATSDSYIGVIGLRAAGRPPLPVMVVPLLPSVAIPGLLQLDHGVCLLFADPARSSDLSSDIISETFSLSRAETEVAIAIANGRSPVEIAACKNISEHTVRTQLKSAMHKTGVSRQTQLVKLMLDTPRARQRGSPPADE